jgi:hypothetical protein
MSSSGTDSQQFTGLLDVPEGYHAQYRDMATASVRWMSPDPYDGHAYHSSHPRHI